MIFFLAIASIAGFAFIANPEIKTIDLGTICPMTDVKMKAVDNSIKSLADCKLSNGLLVVFSCNTCPFVVGDGESSEGWDGRYCLVLKKVYSFIC